MMSVIMLSVVMLNVVVPFESGKGTEVEELTLDLMF
jgi:hypothetical protein